ncbi:UNVERIFIED_CONTAM: putative secreted protein with C-terminal beta-propeller domain [Acetivibrio alkalicellulosi]
MKKVLSIISLVTLLILLTTPFHMSFAEEKTLEDRLKGSVVLYIGSSQAIVNNVEKQVDPSNYQVKPYIKDGRTLVPVRFISENMGADVQWEASTSTVIVTMDKKVVKLVIGSKTMKVGNKDIELDVAPEISEDRTYLPLRSLVEALGKKVFYDRGLIIIGDKDEPFDKEVEKGLIDQIIARVNDLPTVGSYETLKNLIENSGYSISYGRGNLTFDAMEADMATNSIAEEAPSAAMTSREKESSLSQSESSSAGADDYSTTNVQVQGVDEADVVKTDGKFIYQVNKNRIIIARAYPYEQMKIEGMLKFEDDNFSPLEIYIDENYLVVIGTYYDYSTSSKLTFDDNRISILPYYNSRSTVKAIVFDISNKSDITKLREVEIEGNYISSRKIGSILYLIANKHAGGYYVEDKMEFKAPEYRDTLISDEYANIDYSDIKYFPDFVEPQYLMIAAFDIKSDDKANINTYLGSGHNIYASSQNLYVAVSNFNFNHRIMPIGMPEEEISVPLDEAASAIMPEPFIISEDNRTTTVYKFSLNKSDVTYLSKGEVPGTILNQFSMDESNGFFRIATTVGDMWGWGDNISRNNVYILDDTMHITGKIENIAPGERIYSVRFMGDRGYVVTFREVDPFFVIDLKDPQNPMILGELKIPGFSDYLHPYDENHIMGFGKDTVEMSNGVFVSGMKLALFDVTDVSNPIQKFSEIIGGRGTDSELLRNHRALLFSKEKNLLAFPVTVVEEDEFFTRRYKGPDFQGAYVYNIDIENGFVLRGKITHLSKEDYSKDDYYYYSYDKYIERLLYIDDTLYTLSKGMIMANGLEKLEERNKLIIPE